MARTVCRDSLEGGACEDDALPPTAAEFVNGDCTPFAGTAITGAMGGLLTKLVLASMMEAKS